MAPSLRSAVFPLATLVGAVLGCAPSPTIERESATGRPPSEGAAAERSEAAKYRLNPTPDTTFPAGLFVPSNLLEAFEELDRMLTREFRSEFAADSSQISTHHFGLGLWMRNNWGLWSGSRLAHFFNELGICHPDDMSSIVLNSYWRRNNDRPLLVEEQVIRHRDYWRAQGAPECAG